MDGLRIQLSEVMEQRVETGYKYRDIFEKDKLM